MYNTLEIILDRLFVRIEYWRKNKSRITLRCSNEKFEFEY